MGYVYMSQTPNNGVQISGKTIISNNEMIVNGERVPRPPCEPVNVTIINDKVYINGWEYVGHGKWRKTLKALWHKYF